MYGMRKTTVYLPDELAAGLKRAARTKGVSEADLIRHGVTLAIAEVTPPRPRTGFFDSGIPDFAHRVDEFLEGFGED